MYSIFSKYGYWNDYLIIDKTLFKENYDNSEVFKGLVDGLFRHAVKKDSEWHKQRLQKYMTFTSLK